jgi:hypothetical protein
VGSLERTVLSQARRFHALQLTDAELEAPRTVEDLPRPLTNAELLASAEASRPVVRLTRGRDDEALGLPAAGHG